MAYETLEQAVAAGERAAETDREREQRIANCEMEFSDGFLSSWADGLTKQKGALAQAVIDAGGTWYFWRVELVSAETGEKVKAKLIDSQFGGKSWMLLDGGGRRTGEYVTAHAKREATMVRKGYRERIVIFAADAAVDIAGSGKGLAGAHTCRAVVRTADYTVEYTGTCGGGTREAAERHAQVLRENGYGWQDIGFA